MSGPAGRGRASIALICPRILLLLLLGLGRRLVRLQRIDLLLARRLGLGLGLPDRTLRKIHQHRRQERHPDLEDDEEQREGGEDDVERARRLRQRRVRHGISRRKGVRHGHRGSRVLGRSRDGPGATQPPASRLIVTPLELLSTDLDRFRSDGADAWGSSSDRPVRPGVPIGRFSTSSGRNGLGRWIQDIRGLLPFPERALLFLTP